MLALEKPSGGVFEIGVLTTDGSYQEIREEDANRKRNCVRQKMEFELIEKEHTEIGVSFSTAPGGEPRLVSDPTTRPPPALHPTGEAEGTCRRARTRRFYLSPAAGPPSPHRGGKGGPGGPPNLGRLRPYKGGGQGRGGGGGSGGRERAEGKSRRAWRGGGAEGGQPGCGKRGSALGLVPSQPFSVQPNSRFAEGANQGRTGGLCLAPANDW
ncbi:PREDICTED: glycine-rich protein 2-like [Haliaeetus leucocephalus]|uniref:glycine-rich protein 2-like n=1 Tax=Haliaeetus leucocephalus TaxID=52644 RepID=UPI00053CC784|nr:PREDICTED: glycine-rich protein 2-like [Haliaeetus leucocephalus]